MIIKPKDDCCHCIVTDEENQRLAVHHKEDAQVPTTLPELSKWVRSREWEDVTDQYPKLFMQEHLGGGDPWYLIFDHPGQTSKSTRQQGAIEGLIEWPEEKVAEHNDLNEGSDFMWQEITADTFEDDDTFDYADHPGQADGDLEDYNIARAEAVENGSMHPDESLAAYVRSIQHEIERRDNECDELQSKLAEAVTVTAGPDVDDFKFLAAKVDDLSHKLDEEVSLNVSVEETPFFKNYVQDIARRVSEVDDAMRMCVVAGLIGSIIAAVTYASMMYQIFWSKG